MNSPLILLHEEALRVTHPVFIIAPLNTRAIFVWDDDYFQANNYSFKRLVFIYETLCKLPIDIIQGNRFNVISEMSPTTLYIPASNNPILMSVIKKLSSFINLEIIDDEAFSYIKSPRKISRFSQYWKKIENSVFNHNGDVNSQND